ncbi:MAG: T9SS type A sorting domain-containing protein [Bacteroidales bacterium]
MKKTMLLLTLGTLFLTAKSQTILTNETHGFVPNERNPMMLTNYVDPSNSGKNAVWNFSNLEVNNNFVGLIHDTFVSKSCSLFPKGNTILEEFGNYFVFESSKESLAQYGLVTSTGQTRIQYSKPFIKMKYPFTYGSNFAGEFEGDYISNEKVIGQVSGSYRVEGDAKGQLELPNGTVLDNTLRVKEVKTTKQVINNVTTQIEDVSYRWYVQNHRFPVLVLIKSTYTPQNGKPSTSTRAAFNSDVVNLTNNVENLTEDVKLDIYPNPYQGRVTISYNLEKTSNINISVFDLTGKLVDVIANGTEDSGVKKHYFSATEKGMSAGAYIVKIKIDNTEISRKILEMK